MGRRCCWGRAGWHLLQVIRDRLPQSPHSSPIKVEKERQDRERLEQDMRRARPAKKTGCLGTRLLGIVRLAVLLFVVSVALGLIVMIAAYAR